MNKSETRTNFYHQKPGKGRKSFIILRLDVKNGIKKTKKVKSEALDAVNAAYLSGTKPLDTCTLLVKEIIQNLYTELERLHPKVVHNSANRVLFEKFWATEYQSRDLVDPTSAKNDFKRAIEAVGELSLYTATAADLQNKVAENVSGNAQRRVVTNLNALLEFIGRDIQLRKNKKKKAAVKHLSLKDFQKILSYIEDPDVRLLTESAFGCGGRTGELFAIRPERIRSAFVMLHTQIDRELEDRETKNRIERKAFIIPEFRKSLATWAAVENKEQYRNIKLAEVVKAACKKAFPTDSSKYITFHDLRHSYAIHLLSKEVTLDLVSQSLGNSIIVCQEYYAGFVLTDEGIESISRKFQKS